MPKQNEKEASTVSTDIVAFRSRELKVRIETLATLDERSQSQMARLLMKRAVEMAEKELGITHPAR